MHVSIYEFLLCLHGLVNVFEEIFERIKHELCLRHLYENFKKKFGGGTSIRDIMMGATKVTYYQGWLNHLVWHSLNQLVWHKVRKRNPLLSRKIQNQQWRTKKIKWQVEEIENQVNYRPRCKQWWTNDHTRKWRLYFDSGTMDTLQPSGHFSPTRISNRRISTTTHFKP